MIGGLFTVTLIFVVSVAITMSDTSHAFASSSSSSSSSSSPSSFSTLNKNNGVAKNPWNSKLYANSASSSPSSSSSTTTKNGFSVPVTWNNNNGKQQQDQQGGATNIKTSDVLSLDSIRASLIRQEETIIFALIERAQFRQNKAVYEKGVEKEGNLFSDSDNGNDNDKENVSFLEYMLTETEKLHASVRRYRSPEEHAFYPEKQLVDPTDTVLKQQLEYRSGLLSDIGDASSVNFNEILLKKYIEDVVPAICAKGDDEQHGSSVLNDVAVLQALSKRVHYGKFVAESKYLGDPDAYQALVDANDAEGVMKLLTNEAVELKVLRRARLKAATYGTDPLLADLPPLYGEQKGIPSIVAAAAASAVVAALEALGDDGSDGDNKVCALTVEIIYRDLIIPLTKDVEVAYLFRRCGKEPPPEYAPHRMSTDAL
ncbi:MAG: chorismate mutase [Bacillariaceae sp.]|jgi:chorismate mutase